MSQPRVSELRQALIPLRPYLVTAVVFTTVVALLSLAPIGYMRDVYGPVLNARSSHALFMVTLILIGMLLVSALLEWARSRVMAGASVRFAESMSQRVFDASFRANLLKVPGARQALGDLLVIRNFITSPTMVALMDAPMGLIFLGLVFLINPLMGAFSLFGALVVFVLGIMSERKVSPLMTQAQRFSIAASNFAADSGRNAQVIEAMGMRRAVQQRWLALHNQFLRDQALASAVQAQGSAASKFVMLAQGSLLLGIGVLFTLWGVISPQAGALIIIAKLLGAKAIAPLMQLINSWKQVVVARDSWERLDEFLAKVPEREKRMSMPAPRGHLALENVAVRAPGTKRTVLMDVGLVVKPGRVLGVIGPSGSGKSSLARTIIGLWTPITGAVRLDGVEVSGWDKAELGPHIGYLPQDVELFDGTLAENIARFGEVDRDKVHAAATLAGLDPIVAQLPQGLDTDIGDDGCTLSGGQRQRVGLARAMYGDPRLLVLDEPNSSLDERGEADLIAAIRTLSGRGCTVVLITHRKGLLAATDQLLVLADGRPKMFGPRDQVLAKMGRGPSGADAAPPPPAPAAAGTPPAEAA